MPEITHEFVVDESRWARGGKNGPSMLLNGRGYMCCLGFYGLSRGLTEAQIKRVPSPIAFAGKVREAAYEPVFPYCTELMCTNDDRSITDDTRKYRLTELFGSIGVRVTFVPGGEA